MSRPSSSSGWLPLVHSAHLPLPHFAHCYSTTALSLSADEADASRDQLLIATTGALFAVQPERTRRSKHATHTRAQARDEQRSHSSSNLAAAAASPSAPAPAPALSAVPSFSSLSSLCALPLRGLPADGAELIAVDSFTVGRDRRPVLCVAAGLIGSGAHGKPLGAPTRFVLCIYGLHCPRTDDLHVIAQDCVSIKLAFVPFVLTHSTLLQQRSASGEPPSVDILLSGSDRSVHVYRWSSVTRTYAELPFTPAHPLAHLHSTPSAVLSLDVACSAERSRGQRWTFVAAGHQDGLVRVATRREDCRQGEQQPQQQRSPPPDSRSEEKAAESAVSPWQLGDDDDRRIDADATAVDPALAPVPSSSSASECSSPFAAAASSLCPSSSDLFRYADSHLDGPVSSARFFSPSTFMADVFRDNAHGAADEQTALNDNRINRMQTRAYEQCNQAHRQQRDEAGAESRSRRPRPPSEVRLLLSNAVGFGAVFGSDTQRDQRRRRRRRRRLGPVVRSFVRSLCWSLPVLCCAVLCCVSSLCRRSVDFSSACYLSASGCVSSASPLSLLSPSLDAVLCAAPLDLNLDGRAELLLGSYSAQLCVFQEHADGHRRHTHDDHHSTADSASSVCVSLSAPSGYLLSTRRQFSSPVYGVRSGCVFGSGCADLVVTCMWSVDVLSWHCDSAAAVMHNKLRCMDEIEQLETACAHMQQQQQQQQQRSKHTPPNTTHAQGSERDGQERQRAPDG